MDTTFTIEYLPDNKFHQLLSILANKKNTKKQQRQEAKKELENLDFKALALETNIQKLPALYKAVWAGSYSTSEKLLNAGADPNISDPSLPEETPTPLHCASSMGHYNLVELLLQHGAQANTRNTQDATSLHLAAQRGHAGVVQVLLEYGADSNAVLDKFTPLGLVVAPALNLDNPQPVEILKNNNLRTIVKMLIAHDPQSASIDTNKFMWSEIKEDDFKQLLSDLIELNCAIISESELNPEIKRRTEWFKQAQDPNFICSPWIKISRWSYEFLLTCLRTRKKPHYNELEALYKTLRTDPSFRSDLEAEIARKREARKSKNTDKNDKNTVKQLLEKLTASQSSGTPLVTGAYTQEDAGSAEPQRNLQGNEVAKIREILEIRAQESQV